MKKIILLLSLIYLLFPSSVFAATLSLKPSSGNFAKGCTYNIAVELDTAGSQTAGTDAIILYDPTKMITSTDKITNGTIYSDYLGNTVDPQNRKIIISGIASPSQSFSGKGTLATISFSIPNEAQAGAAQVTFDFDQNDRSSTKDSNVAEKETVADVLTGVTNGSYTIVERQGSCTVTGGSAQTPGNRGTASGSAQLPAGGPEASGSTGTNQPKVIDDYFGGQPSGSLETTVFLSIIGTTLVILGLIGLAIL